MLLPALQGSRDRALQSFCSNNHPAIGTCDHLYSNDNAAAAHAYRFLDDFTPSTNTQ